MKKSLSLILIAGLFAGSANASMITSIGDASLAGATLQTFDSVANGSYASLALPGVTVVGNGSTMSVDSTFTASYGIGGQTLHNESGTPRSFELLFSSPVSAFGIWSGAVNNSWTYSAYDSNNVLIESIVTSGACCSPEFYGIADAGISRVTLQGNGDWAIFDNLLFVADQRSNVPEPAGLALLGLGLVGLVASRRRKTA